MQTCNYAIMKSCNHAIMQSCNHAIVLKRSADPDQRVGTIMQLCKSEKSERHYYVNMIIVKYISILYGLLNL